MYKNKEVNELTGVSESTINSYIQAYKKGAIEGLVPKKSLGRSRNLLPEQEEELKEVIISKNLVDVGFPANWNWTAQIIKEYVYRKYGAKYSIKGMTIVLKRLNLSYTRPTYTLAKVDPKKQEQIVQKFEDFKKTY